MYINDMMRMKIFSCYVSSGGEIVGLVKREHILCVRVIQPLGMINKPLVVLVVVNMVYIPLFIG